ncbi:hypothetical protein [Alteromonas oceanisediminis]|uniref:hypothetical protein n=1 Tax=Alteromonas oceanisediminis TaxID=2836180 RepID=UPI001BD9D7CD|nr:hypothetical protein [Alteromonas oceanisediminis]MBT0584938.1 hypothetical protein [Alteromonas oceanisediminis]
MFEVAISVLVLVAYRSATFFYEKSKISERYGDDLAHLSFVKELKRTDGQSSDLSWLYPLGKFDYPTGFHRFVYASKLSMNFVEQYGGLIPTIVDIIFVAVAGCVLFLLNGHVTPWIIALPLCRLFYGHDGRSIHFSERAWGILFGSCYLLLNVYLIQFDGNFLAHAISVGLFIVFSCSSKFAWQATFLVSLLMALFTGKLAYLSYFLLHCIGAIALTKGYSLRVLAGLIRHSYFYKTYLATRHPTVKDHYAELADIVARKKPVSTVFHNSLCRILLDNPFNLVVLYAATQSDLNIWLQFSLIGCVLTSLIGTKWLGFLGEPERYLDFCIIPSLIVVSSFGSELPIGLAGLMLITFIVVFIKHLGEFRERCRVQNKKQQNVALIQTWFSNVRDKTILTIPFRYGIYAGYDMEPSMNNRILTLHTNIGDNQQTERYKRLLGPRYPFPHNNIDELIIEFSIDLILVDKAAVAFLHKEIPDYYQRFNRFIVIEESKQFMLVAPRC